MKYLRSSFREQDTSEDNNDKSQLAKTFKRISFNLQFLHLSAFFTWVGGTAASTAEVKMAKIAEDNRRQFLHLKTTLKTASTLRFRAPHSWTLLHDNFSGFDVPHCNESSPRGLGIPQQKRRLGISFQSKFQHSQFSK